MRVVFMGTPEFSCGALQSLVAAGHDIICAYSQPPKPKGRGLNLHKQPVHILAESLGIEVRHPLSLKSAVEQERFASLKADVAVVVAYGLLLPKAILEAPKFGCLNIHASLLPRWRGAAPIQRAIMAGDKATGVCIMQMDEGLDTGAVLARQSLPIKAQTTAASLHDELSKLGANMIVESLASLPKQAKPQPEGGVTYAKKIDKSEAHIDFNRSAEAVARHIHGLSPFPGAWCEINGARVKILSAELHPSHEGGRWREATDGGLSAKSEPENSITTQAARPPSALSGTFPLRGKGEVGKILDDKLTISCAQGAIRPLRLQREGKGALSIEEFLRGNSIPIGAKAT